MKAIILFITFPVVALFTLVGLQTVEWCVDQNIPVPWQAYTLLAFVVVWGVIAVNTDAKEWKKVDRFFRKLTDKDKQSK